MCYWSSFIYYLFSLLTMHYWYWTERCVDVVYLYSTPLLYIYRPIVYATPNSNMMLSAIQEKWWYNSKNTCEQHNITQMKVFVECCICTCERMHIVTLLLYNHNGYATHLNNIYPRNRISLSNIYHSYILPYRNGNDVDVIYLLCYVESKSNDNSVNTF